MLRSLVGSEMCIRDSLNGTALIAEGQSEIEKLDEELKLQVAGGQGYHFTIG